MTYIDGRSRRALRATALVAVSALAGLAVSVLLPASVHAADKPADTSKLTTFGVQPASATKQDARPAFTYGVTPGASLQDHVAFLNYSTKPLTLVVYPADGLNTETGGFSLEQQSVKPTDAGAWIKLGGTRTNGAGLRTVTVPARGKASAGRVILPITVAVPAKATPGDHVGGIVASLPTSSAKKDGANLKLDQRVASRVYVRVSGPLEPKLTVDQVHASYHGRRGGAAAGSATVTYVVHNVGNAKLASRQQVVLDGWFGGHKATPVSQIPLLLPGSSLEMRAEIADVLPLGRFNATVNVQPVSVSGDVDPVLVAVSASTHFWAVPWVLIALVVLLVLGTAAWIARRRHRARPSSGSHARNVTTPDSKATQNPEVPVS